jgi:hypothetical protein
MRAQAALVLPEPARCVFCHKYVDESHHPAGRNHYPWFVVPLCKFHHRMVTKAEDVAGVKIEWTDDVAERTKRARQQCLAFLWLLDLEEINHELR